MPENSADNNNAVKYSRWIAFVFIFNLIVGTGALMVPAIFAKAGWLLSLFVVTFLAGISYITVTLIIETMACANAVKVWQQLQGLKTEIDENNGDESDSDVMNLLLPCEQQRGIATAAAATNILSADRNAADSSSDVLSSNANYSYYYQLVEKFELGEMALLFFNDFGRMLLYLCIAIYLYGDLSIYSAAVAKSLRDIVCNKWNDTISANNATVEQTLCWNNHTLSRFDVYRLFIIGCAVLLGPLTIFSIQKTKFIQILTVICRWLAFILMIALASKSLFINGLQGHPAAVNLSGLPALFGVCVYAFMCHHSLPSLLTPLEEKRRLGALFAGDYALVCAFYALLSMTGVFAFAKLEDLYVLNFFPADNSSSVTEYFLAFFPVFTLSASFPIIAITLRSNLQALFLDMTRIETYNFFVRHLLFALLAVLPPFTVTFFTENLTSLVAFTGSYAGVGIQYLIPVALVYCARRSCAELLGNGIVNAYASPCRSNCWLLFVLGWALACVCLVTLNFCVGTAQQT